MSDYDFSENININDFSEEIDLTGKKSTEKFNPSEIEAPTDLFPGDHLEEQKERPYHPSKAQKQSEIILQVQDFLISTKEFNLDLPQNSPRVSQAAEDSTQNSEDGNKPCDHKEQIKIGKDYDKNIIGYVTRKAITMMFANHRQYLIRKCNRSGVEYKDFYKFYQTAEKQIYGPASLSKIFRINRQNTSQTKIKFVFNSVFYKILRKNYIIYTVRQGKMQALQPYIRKKNSQLLYFADWNQMY